MVTAEHVGSQDRQKADLREERKLEVRNGSNKEIANIHRTSGLFNFSGDIMMTKYEWNGPTLTPIESNQIPGLGQKMWAVGFLDPPQVSCALSPAPLKVLNQTLARAENHFTSCNARVS